MKKMLYDFFISNKPFLSVLILIKFVEESSNALYGLYKPFQKGNKMVNNHELKGVYLSVIYCVGVDLCYHSD